MNPRVACAAALCALLFGATAARAQVFSPGPLAKAHAALDGLTTCTQCHESGARVSNARCLDCHREIASRQEAKSGFHGRVAEHSCGECHREHKGKSARLVDWGGPVRNFDHRRTGWPLTGAHAAKDCKACHDARRITDPVVQGDLQKGRATYLGMPVACSACHFDEHRGQEGTSCDKCHSTERFQPAASFNHNRTDFALTGKHQQVRCAQCHQNKTDETTPSTAFPAPVSREFMTLSGIAHGRCTDCHEDKHQGRFGQNCTACHSTKGWLVINSGQKDLAFHETTRFPLRGEHIGVACKSCHGPWRGEPAKFRGTAHDRCSDCHADAHEGQLGALGQARGQCSRCHSVEGFTPVQFGADQHAKARFALDGGHRAVACAACHTNDRALPRKAPEAALRELRKKGRPELFAAVRLVLPEITGRCEQCHKDPHGGQFDARVKDVGCTSCHKTSAFTDVTFDHGTTRFVLTGKHAQVVCAGCHQPGPGRGNAPGPVVYKETPMICARCHVDVHKGQFEANGDKPALACIACHETSGFKPTTYNHNDPQRSSWPLTGKHADVACAKCHPTVAVAKEGVRRYRPVPTSCAGCHVDAHDGRFAGFSQ